MLVLDDGMAGGEGVLARLREEDEAPRSCAITAAFSCTPLVRIPTRSLSFKMFHPVLARFCRFFSGFSGFGQKLKFWRDIEIATRHKALLIFPLRYFTFSRYGTSFSMSSASSAKICKPACFFVISMLRMLGRGRARGTRVDLRGCNTVEMRLK